MTKLPKSAGHPAPASSSAALRVVPATAPGDAAAVAALHYLEEITTLAEAAIEMMLDIHVEPEFVQKQKILRRLIGNMGYVAESAIQGLGGRQSHKGSTIDEWLLPDAPAHELWEDDHE